MHNTINRAATKDQCHGHFYKEESVGCFLPLQSMAMVSFITDSVKYSNRLIITASSKKRDALGSRQNILPSHLFSSSVTERKQF